MNRMQKILAALSRWKPWSDTGGVAAVEFALIAPIAIGAAVGEFTLCEILHDQPQGDHRRAHHHRPDRQAKLREHNGCHEFTCRLGADCGPLSGLEHGRDRRRTGDRRQQQHHRRLVAILQRDCPDRRNHIYA